MKSTIPVKKRVPPLRRPAIITIKNNIIIYCDERQINTFGKLLLWFINLVTYRPKRKDDK